MGHSRLSISNSALFTVILEDSHCSFASSLPFDIGSVHDMEMIVAFLSRAAWIAYKYSKIRTL